MWDFLQDPQAVGGGILSAAIGALSIYLRILEWRNKQRLAKASSIPPTPLPDAAAFAREITGAHQAMRELRTTIEQETAVRRTEWANDDLRAALAEKDREMAEIVKDASKTGAALAASEEHRNQLIMDLDRTRQEKAAYKLAYEAEQAKNATLANAKADSDARLVIKQRELDACERRAGAIALELHDRKHEEASGHSVELALDEDRHPTPLRPPALPGRPKETR